MKLRLNVLLLLITLTSITAQVVSSDPPFPTEDDFITITFDATQATNKSLVGYTGDLYVHTGVNTATQNWQYVIGTWGNNTTQPKLTRIGTDLYELEIGYPREFYNVTSSNVKITSLNFVFRSANASQQTEDIFLPISEGGLEVTILQPSSPFTIKQVGDELNITAISSSADSLYLFLNDELLTQTDKDTITYTLSATEEMSKYIIAKAVDSQSNSVSDSAIFIVRGEVQEAELPDGIMHGINYTSETSVTLALFAPMKEYVYVTGDFNDWLFGPDSYMKRTPNDSTYWIEITGLASGEEYAFQYLVDGELLIADPYTDKVLDPWNDSYITDDVYPNLKTYPFGKTTEPVSVFQTAQEEYDWQVKDFQRPPQDNLIIYELLIRDFVASHSYETIIDTLDYLERLGVNAIELMPIYEFEGNISWGYNPSFMFAVDKYYGTKNALKKFIDECHARGIAVILDMVLNHQFGQSPLVRLYWDNALNRPSFENPWFNPIARHPFNVGYDMNHESKLTQEFVDRVNKYWLEEFKFDGYRFDLSKGFMQTGSFYDYNASRIALLKRMYDVVRTYDEDAYMILEHLGQNNEETELANYGFMLWGKMTDQYNEATMGYHDNNKSDLSWISYQTRGWNDPHLVGYMESHDEERLMYKNLLYGNSNGSYNIQELVTALQRMKMAAAFFFTIPGPKMIWQFGELGYDYSINYPSGTDNDRLTPKPIRWDYQDILAREKLFKTFSAIINLKKNYEAFNTDDFQLSVSGSIKKIKLYHESMNVYIIGNFGVTSNGQPLDFQSTGTWYNFFTGDSVEYTSSAPFQNLLPGDFHIFTTEKLPTPEGDIISNVIQEHDEIPVNYSLSQNYPNPFNPSTTIHFSIPSQSFVNISIYNVLGEKIKTLLAEEMQPGSFQISWNGTNDFNQNLSSGVYIYRIDADNFFQSRKMILLK